jgi:nicotinamide mononucleotide (NMN) deamidase PncC
MLVVTQKGVPMVIHDDANMETVVKETISAMDEGARHIGKADRAISKSQIAGIEGAIGRLQLALKHKTPS